MEFTFLQKIAIWAIPVIFAITVHEVAHGWVASLFGDKTAKLAGRLTLNPMKHIDMVGTIIVPLLLLMTSKFLFGWAKPVPVDSRNLRHPRYNMVIVSLAGPAANLLMAIFWAGIAKIATYLSAFYAVPLYYMGQAGMMINTVLAVLNCLPIPPLDGGHALMNLLPGKWGWYMHRFESYGFIILVILIMTRVLNSVMEPIVYLFLNELDVLFGLS